MSVQSSLPSRKLGRFPATKILASDPTTSVLTEKLLDAIEHTGAATEPQASNDRERGSKNSWVKLYNNLFREDRGLFATTIQPPRDVSALKMKVCQLWDDFENSGAVTDEKLSKLREKAVYQKSQYQRVVEESENAREAGAKKREEKEAKLAAVEIKYGGRPAGCRGTAKAGGRPYASTSLKLHEKPAAFLQHKKASKKAKKEDPKDSILDNERPIDEMQSCLDELKTFTKDLTKSFKKGEELKDKENKELAEAIGAAVAKNLAASLAGILPSSATQKNY